MLDPTQRIGNRPCTDTGVEHVERTMSGKGCVRRAQPVKCRFIVLEYFRCPNRHADEADQLFRFVLREEIVCLFATRNRSLGEPQGTQQFRA